MEYVMMPVPEQYLDRLSHEIMRLAVERAMATWAPDDVADLLRELDSGPRSLLVWLAPARLTGVATSVADAAAVLHCTRDEVMAHRQQINRWAADRGRPEVLIHDTRPMGGPSGGPARDHLLVSPHVAKLVRDVARSST